MLTFEINYHDLYLYQKKKSFLKGSKLQMFAVYLEGGQVAEERPSVTETCT